MVKFSPRSLAASNQKVQEMNAVAQQERRPAGTDDAEQARRRERFERADKGLASGSLARPFAFNATPAAPADTAAPPAVRPLARTQDDRPHPEKRLISFAPDDLPVVAEVRAKLLRQGISATQSDAVRIAVRLALEAAPDRLADEHARLTKMKAGRTND